MLIQCTKSLLDKIGIKGNELEAPEVQEFFPNCSMNWHAHFVTMNRRKAIVLMNNETRYPVVIYRPVSNDFKQIKPLIKKAITEALYMEGFSFKVINSYMDMSGDIVFSKTTNRSTVAKLNNAVREVERMGDHLDESTKVQRFISMLAGRMPQRYETADYSYPIEKMHDMLGRFAQWRGIEGELLAFQLYQLHIQIDLEGHAIWRRVLVPSTYSFRYLHNIIQAVFDWQNYHLHEFTVNRINNKPLQILMDDSPDMMEFIDLERFAVAQERFVTLEDIFQVGIPVDYMYDFGDGWDHVITLEKIVDGHAFEANYIEGNGERPPEDVGGAPGFEEYLEVMSDKKHPEHEFMKTWAESQKERHRTHEEINRQLRQALSGYRYIPYF